MATDQVVSRYADAFGVSLSTCALCDGGIFRDFHAQQLGLSPSWKLFLSFFFSIFSSEPVFNHTFSDHCKIMYLHFFVMQGSYNLGFSCNPWHSGLSGIELSRDCKMDRTATAHKQSKAFNTQTFGEVTSNSCPSTTATFGAQTVGHELEEATLSTQKWAFQRMRIPTSAFESSKLTDGDGKCTNMS